MKREWGQGTITTDARTGRFRARVSVNGKRVSVPGTFDSEKQAHDAIAHFWARCGRRSRRRSGSCSPTVAEWGVTYLDARETDGVHRSVQRDRSVWRARIASSKLGGLNIDTMTSRDVREWLRDQVRTPTDRGKRPARTTVANALNLLRVALEEAVQADHIGTNPARDVRMPRIAVDSEGWDWLRAHELEKLFTSSALAGQARWIFTVAIYTGLRKGELWGLRWQDVDFERGELSVAKSYGGPTKSGKPRRVPLLEPALRAITAMPRRCNLVFPTHDVRMRNRNDSAGWEGLCEAAGVRRVRFHDLRHTCASHLVQGSWVPEFMHARLRIEEVQQWLGHRSIRTTERYAHLCDEALLGRVKRAAVRSQTPRTSVVPTGARG